MFVDQWLAQLHLFLIDEFILINPTVLLSSLSIYIKVG